MSNEMEDTKESNRLDIGVGDLLDAKMLIRTNRLHLLMTDLTMHEILLAVAGHAAAKGEGTVCQAIMDILMNQGECNE